MTRATSLPIALLSMLALAQHTRALAADPISPPSPAVALSSDPTKAAAITAEPSNESGKTANTSPVLLPTVVVDAKKEVIPAEKDILTKAGLSAVYRKSYPGASTKGQDPTDSSRINFAQQMYQDDLRLSQRATFTRFESALGQSGDPAGAKALKAEINRTFIRRPDFKTEAVDRNVNRGRR